MLEGSAIINIFFTVIKLFSSRKFHVSQKLNYFLSGNFTCLRNYKLFHFVGFTQIDGTLMNAPNYRQNHGLLEICSRVYSTVT